MFGGLKVAAPNQELPGFFLRDLGAGNVSSGQDKGQAFNQGGVCRRDRRRELVEIYCNQIFVLVGTGRNRLMVGSGTARHGAAFVSVMGGLIVDSTSACCEV